MEATLDDTQVMYVISSEGPAGAADAFKKLEDAINWELKGRKFYGTMMGMTGEYRANMSVKDDDNFEKLGFKTSVIPGGKYYKEKINDWEKHVAEIAPKCNEIIAKIDYDNSRPIIEFYRSQAELFIFIPIK
jgi:muconolactone delta-isomerase